MEVVFSLKRELTIEDQNKVLSEIKLWPELEYSGRQRQNPKTVAAARYCKALVKDRQDLEKVARRLKSLLEVEDASLPTGDE